MPSSRTHVSLASIPQDTRKTRTIGAIVPLSNVVRNAELPLGLQGHFRVLPEKEIERLGSPLTWRAKDMRNFGRINQLAPPNELLAGGPALLLAIFSQRDIRVSRALPRDRPLRLSYQTSKENEKSTKNSWQRYLESNLILPCRAMKTLGVVAFASDIVRAQVLALAPVCWSKA